MTPKRSSPADLERAVRNAQRRARRAEVAAAVARQQRDDVIRGASKRGFTHSQIARATDLTPERIGQIVNGPDR